MSFDVESVELDAVSFEVEFPFDVESVAFDAVSFEVVFPLDVESVAFDAVSFEVVFPFDVESVELDVVSFVVEFDDSVPLLVLVLELRVFGLYEILEFVTLKVSPVDPFTLAIVVAVEVEVSPGNRFVITFQLKPPKH